MTRRRLARLALKAAGLALVMVATLIGVRAWDAWQGAPLDPWHVETPDEPDAPAIDAMGWEAWLAAEARAFAQMRAAAVGAVDRLVPRPPRRWRLTVIGNESPASRAVVERSKEAGAMEATVRPIGLDDPDELFSLSHVSPPFPPWDGLYGMRPDPAEDFGIRLGVAPTRGETGALRIGAEVFLRLASNPFHAWCDGRLAEAIR